MKVKHIHYHYEKKFDFSDDLRLTTAEMSTLVGLVMFAMGGALFFLAQENWFGLAMAVVLSGSGIIFHKIRSKHFISLLYERVEDDPATKETGK